MALRATTDDENGWGRHFHLRYSWPYGPPPTMKTAGVAIFTLAASGGQWSVPTRPFFRQGLSRQVDLRAQQLRARPRPPQVRAQPQVAPRHAAAGPSPG